MDSNLLQCNNSRKLLVVVAVAFSVALARRPKFTIRKIRHFLHCTLEAVVFCCNMDTKVI